MVYSVSHKNYPYNALLRLVDGLLFILVLANLSTYATTDTTKIKQQYDINDPRNPDCPCHKYQKLAEEEYARQNHSLTNTTNNSFGSISKTNSGLAYYEPQQLLNIGPVKDPELSTAQSSNDSFENKVEHNAVTKTKSTTYRSVRSSNLHSPRKRTHWHLKAAFRFYLLCKRLKPLKFKAQNSLCFKWN